MMAHQVKEQDLTHATEPELSANQGPVRPPPVFIPKRAVATESDHAKVSRIMTVVLFGGIVFAIAAAAVVYFYLINISPRSYRLTRSDGVEETPTPAPVATPRPTPALGRTATGELIPVTADDLHVTSISLGNLRLCITNGKRLAENDFLEIKTSMGTTYVRLTNLEDGVAHFEYAGQPIDAKLQLSLVKKPVAPQPIDPTH
jgi:hypothetical protein